VDLNTMAAAWPLCPCWRKSWLHWLLRTKLRYFKITHLKST
jgi:hypothetical protein